MGLGVHGRRLVADPLTRVDQTLAPVVDLVALILAHEGRTHDPLRVAWLVVEAIADAPGCARLLAAASMDRGTWSDLER